MKTVYKILSSVLAVFVFCACDVSNVSNTEIDVPIDMPKSYIHFDTGISSRGSLVTGNVLQADFYVLGYMYRGDWNTAKVMATPNVFDSTPEEVTYNSGIYSYSETKPWTGNDYSFFAFYPANNSSIKLFDDGTSKLGEPYITYTLPLDENPKYLLDVMTASYIDTNVGASSSVVFNMKHRLSCVDICARNYAEYDHDGNSTTPKEPVTIKIKSLEVSFNNLINRKAKIFLNPDIETEAITTGAGHQFNILTSSKDIAPNTSSDTGLRYITTQSGEDASSLILIPQEEFLKGTLEISYTKEYDGSTIETVDSKSINFAFNRSLLEGRRYYIQLTFTSDAVSVEVVAADEWDDLDNNVDFEFE